MSMKVHKNRHVAATYRRLLQTLTRIVKAVSEEPNGIREKLAKYYEGADSYGIDGSIAHEETGILECQSVFKANVRRDAIWETR